MKKTRILVAATGAAALLATAGAALAQEPIGQGITMYMQMGGTTGAGTVRPQTIDALVTLIDGGIR